MNLELSSPVVEAAGLIMTILAAVWSLAWWLSGQFTKILSLIYSTAEKTTASIMSKLEYHEQHDDTRFNQVTNQIADVKNDIWDMKLRHAAKLTPLSKNIKLKEND